MSTSVTLPTNDAHLHEIFIKYLNITALKSDPVSVADARKFWDEIFSLRTSLGCYKHHNGNKELAGLNACLVKSLGDPPLDFSHVRNIIFYE